MADNRVAKRARVEDDSAPASVGDVAMAETEASAVGGDGENDEDGGNDTDAPERSTTVWLDDGNIILEAEGKQFRVHKSILSQNSRVFEDMFKVPQPLPTCENTVDGCPVVKLEGDDSDHWEWLLELLYDGRRNYATSSRLEFGLIEALITLGDKYGFEHLQKDALAEIENSFPRQLTYFSSNDYPEAGFCMTASDTLCDVINLAQWFKIETSLPALYYFSLIYDLPNILVTGLCGETGKQTEISEETRLTLITGRDRICEGMAKHQFRWLWPDSRLIPSKECTRQTSCRNALDVLLARFWRPVPQVISALRPYNKTLHATGLCSTCTSIVQTEYRKGQKTFWMELPTYFNLPPWEKLKDGPPPAT
ncbi:hypothetical protein BKA70DRAFT_1283560 [Coprinopsis sp. MPI-PUGE-AT-0042]|nr:hypothetical protein BKA70DRAFT_1283560 [Coprinopsis sp. MPI-PUGE-AT-0042]